MISKKLLRKGSIFLLANVLNASIPFLLLPILTRVLSPEDYGVIAMFTVFLSFVGAFVGLSVHGAVSVNYFKMTEERFSEFISSSLILLIVSAVGGLAVVGMLGRFLEELIGLPYKWMLIAILVSFFQFILNIQLTVWVVKGEAVRYGVAQVSQTFLNAFGSLFLIFIVGMLWEGRLIGQSITVIFFGIISLLLLYKGGLLRRPSRLQVDVADALKFGVPLIPHAIGAFAIHSTDRVVIANILDVAMVGIYMVAMQLGQAISLLCDSFNKVYSPWLMESLGGQQVDKIKLVNNSYMAMCVFILVGLTWAAVATFLLPYIAGDKFEGARDLILIMCVAFSFTGLYYVVANFIFYSKDTRYLALVTFFCGFINAPLTYLLVKHYALLGAAYSFLIVQILFFLITWCLSSRVYPMPWFYFLKRRSHA
ncbi:lipopolysaccharide biosynthesis protein [Stutzerimonas nitrititolerans]|uniref:Oligosaccharide flippase family protein n=1 Tax=Stutzerimonas nitrititolerans TaxID=2482751 RepID=A0AA41WQF6_9GAMM|nr:oligosaccharide flippase family protein [Stutzerimonas nitrititolerans]MCO7546705.1 oligosaccharide flippase family protein [Stutzerimonas nitrititolerans]